MGTTLTKYFRGANGLPTAERVGTNGPLSYLASDGQGTVSESLDSGGNVTFAQLYTPYGNARYSSGSSPTTLGYTGQRADSATGLDYYQARYYDPVAGQFGSADTVNDALNRYGYVGGNPTTATDPSGHYECFDDSCTRGRRTSGTGPSGSSGSVANDCKTDLDDISDTCANYRDWETRMKHKRWETLSGLRVGAGIALLVAGVADIAADIYEIVHSGGISAKITAAVDALLVIAFGLIPAYQLLTNSETAYSPNADVANIIAGGAYGGGGALLGALVGIARVAKAVVDRLRGVLDLLKRLGPFGEAIASAAVDVAQGLLGGPGMAILNALLALAGQAAEAGIEAGVHTLYAAAWIPKGNFDHQLNMDIGDWCKQNSDACTTPPSRYHTL